MNEPDICLFVKHYDVDLNKHVRKVTHKWLLNGVQSRDMNPNSDVQQNRFYESVPVHQNFDEVLDTDIEGGVRIIMIADLLARIGGGAVSVRRADQELGADDIIMDQERKAGHDQDGGFPMGDGSAPNAAE